MNDRSPATITQETIRDMQLGALNTQLNQRAEHKAHSRFVSAIVVIVCGIVLCLIATHAVCFKIGYEHGVRQGQSQ